MIFSDAVIDKLRNIFQILKHRIVVLTISFNSLYPIVPNGISALFYDKTYFWHARRIAIAQTTVNLYITTGLLQ